MNRKIERRLVKITGIWQIIDGLITILVYGIYQQQVLTGGLSTIEHVGNMFFFICMFGTLLIGLGLFNLILSKRYMKDQETSKKIGCYLLVLGIFSYFIMDFVTMVLAMAAGVIFLARNKSIRISKSTIG
ncbi:hypothetical protein [Enterococcus sp. HY326]|uniref:hypothetical protein n=1 Tax=Enterococcus sp. HY326 TaxID=2971265 RepID=UPI00223F99EA|nr:hypothetical protein [Enterococcus sp. HY326]